MSRRPEGRTVKKAFIPSIRVTPKFKAAIEKRIETLGVKTFAKYIKELIEKDLKE
jgi:predicted DNA-binding protein